MGAERLRRPRQGPGSDEIRMQQRRLHTKSVTKTPIETRAERWCRTADAVGKGCGGMEGGSRDFPKVRVAP